MWQHLNDSDVKMLQQLDGSLALKTFKAPDTTPRPLLFLEIDLLPPREGLNISKVQNNYHLHDLFLI